ncbi:MAG: hypothetical protein ACTSXZ_03780 [Alphaproteobacteria bacterium]
MEAFDKFFVDPTFIVEDFHGRSIGCIWCHGGDKTSLDRDVAHVGLIADPSEAPNSTCTPCHQATVEEHMNSLHFDTAGMFNAIADRAGNISDSDFSVLQTGFQNHCATCHASCGSCHVSRPSAAEGGFLAKHIFQKTPSIQYNCTACHSSRVGDEYMGRNEGCLPDTHWLSDGMLCQECHAVEQLHGNGVRYENRYATMPRPQCVDCHELAGDGNEFHATHAEPNRGGAGFSGASLTCQVCHSGKYKNCFNCHTGIDEQGLAYFQTDASQLAFKIGRNPIVSDLHPEDYTVLRHVPVVRDIFAFYGDDLLPNFSVMPTWKFATPHNITLNTSQNETCNSCHGNDEIFLTANDLAAGEVEANQDVITNGAPQLVPE